MHTGEIYLSLWLAKGIFWYLLEVLRLKMTYVQKESQTNQSLIVQKTKLKGAICDSQQKQYRF